MGIRLPEKAVQIFLANKVSDFNKSVPAIIPEIFSSEFYGQNAITDWINYFDKNSLKVKLGYPNQDTIVPCFYVCAGDVDHDEEYINYAERQVCDDVITTWELHTYTKVARVIAAADNYNIALIMAAMGQYFIHSQNQWFEDQGLSLPKISFPEFDFLSQYWPNHLLYRTFLVTFSVEDTIIVSKDDSIKGINVEIALDDTVI